MAVFFFNGLVVREKINQVQVLDNLERIHLRRAILSRVLGNSLMQASFRGLSSKTKSDKGIPPGGFGREKGQTSRKIQETG